MVLGEGNCTLPEGIDSFDKYERKALKLKDCLELELEERSQVDNVINFFTDKSENFLDDDAFYKLDDIPNSVTQPISITQPASTSQSSGQYKNSSEATQYHQISTTAGPATQQSQTPSR